MRRLAWSDGGTEGIRGLARPSSAVEVGDRLPEPLHRPAQTPAAASHAEQADAHIEAAAAGYGAYAMAALVACLALLGGVLALNVAVDPFAIVGTGLLPTAVENDRTTKLDLIERLERNPEIVILGSSRARQAEPAFLRRLTGRTGFNAAVTSGTAADAWVLTRYAAERFPEESRRYVWFVDVGIATNGVNPQLREDPRAARYLAGKSLDFTLEDVGTYMGTQATRASWRVLRGCVLDTCRGRLRYVADGSIEGATLRYLPEHATSLRRSVARLVAAVRPASGGAGRIDPRRYAYFERALAFMNRHGSRPVIVLNPIHPRVLAALRRTGFRARTAALAYLSRLQERLDFVVVDGQDVRRWGGTPTDWSNATHVNRRNMRLLLRYVVAHSEGALA